MNASNIALRQTRQSIFESADMAEIFLLGNNHPEELGEVPMLKYRLIMQNVTEVMLDIYTQTLMTGFSPETWASQGVTLVKSVLATSGGHAIPAAQLARGRRRTEWTGRPAAAP